MPPNAGYDVMKINISPSLSIGQHDILNDIISTANNSKLDILSDDVKQKGKEMSELYVTLYCIENSLRNFIDTVLSNALGDNLFFFDFCSKRHCERNCHTKKRRESK